MVKYAINLMFKYLDAFISNCFWFFYIRQLRQVLRWALPSFSEVEDKMNLIEAFIPNSPGRTLCGCQPFSKHIAAVFSLNLNLVISRKILLIRK